MAIRIVYWLWPFVIAAIGVLVLLPGKHGDNIVWAFMIACLFGAPVVARDIFLWLPSVWSVGLRFLVALLAMLAILGVELVLAFYLFEVGTNATGYG